MEPCLSKSGEAASDASQTAHDPPSHELCSYEVQHSSPLLPVFVTSAHLPWQTCPRHVLIFFPLFTHFSFLSLFSVFLGLTHAQEREISSLNGKLTEAMEDASKERKAHNQRERENATLQFSVKTLQQKHDDLQKCYQQVTKEMQDLRAAPATSTDQALAGGSGEAMGHGRS